MYVNVENVNFAYDKKPILHDINFGMNKGEITGLIGPNGAILTGQTQKFLGVPKTIDNDLALTDHTPGFGSAAKYIGASTKEVIREGKTIYASGKGATPEYALNSVLKANGIDPEKDVTVEFKSEHAEVVSALVQDQTAVGLLPQPFVTTALMKNDKLKVALDLNKLWEDSMDDGSKLVTGVVIANNEFVQDHADKVNDFMDAYKASVDFVNSDTEAAAQIIGDHDIIAKEVAQKAIPDCSIVFIEGDEMKTMLSGYLATLDDQNPEIIGGQLPDDAFYYKR